MAPLCSPNGSSHRAFTQKLFRAQPDGFLVAAARARTNVSTRRKPPISFVSTLQSSSVACDF